MKGGKKALFCPMRSESAVESWRSTSGRIQVANIGRANKRKKREGGERKEEEIRTHTHRMAKKKMGRGKEGSPQFVAMT